jgi:site-specific DNA-methyltransferase (adenine-specific)
MKKGSKTSAFGSPTRVSHDSADYYRSRLYAGLPDMSSTAEACADEPFPVDWRNQVVCRSSEAMPEIPDCSVHLMVTSPPYNVSKQYDEDLSLPEYLDLLVKVLQETYRVLAWGGRACINVANVGRKPYIPLSDSLSRIMLEIGYLMRGEIIWNKGAGAGVSMAWGSFQSAANPVLRDTHEYIQVYSKGAFGRKKRSDQQNTITKEQFMEWTKSVWAFTPESAKKVGHPAPFPLELPYRLIQLYTFQDDVVLDPFLGSGSTALAALKSGRGFIGYEINPEYVELAKGRIESFMGHGP